MNMTMSKNLAMTSLLMQMLITTGIALVAVPAIAQQPSQQPPKLEPVPDVPPPPPGSSNIGDASEPVVTIRQEGDNKIEEFRINGRHYATRVTPKGGKPYLLVDPDGKGHMNPVDDVPARLRPPQWTLFQF